MNTNKMAAMCLLAVALPFAVVAEMPRSEWHGLVSESAQNPTTLKNTISQLSAAVLQLSATSVCFPSSKRCLNMPSS